MNFINFMTVKCLKSHETKSVLKGNYYYLDRNTIFMDDLGTAYGRIYDFITEKEIGSYRLSRFMTVGMGKISRKLVKDLDY